jgi:hypothetical protein
MLDNELTNKKFLLLNKSNFGIIFHKIERREDEDEQEEETQSKF